MNYIYRQFSILNYVGVIVLYNVRLTYVQTNGFIKQYTSNHSWISVFRRNDNYVK